MQRLLEVSRAVKLDAEAAEARAVGAMAAGQINAIGNRDVQQSASATSPTARVTSRYMLGPTLGGSRQHCYMVRH